MNIEQKIYNKIQEMRLDSSLNTNESKYTYKNNTIQSVSDDYTSNSQDEIVFWYKKVNGQNFIDIE